MNSTWYWRVKCLDGQWSEWTLCDAMTADYYSRKGPMVQVREEYVQ